MADVIRFSLRFASPLIVTPLCPLLAIALCVLPCMGVGLAYWLPDPIGTILGGVFLWIPLGLGLLMVLLLFGLLASWPLLHASIAADNPDVIDSLSRCFSYLHQRFGKFALYVAFAWAAGVPALVAVNLLASGVVHLAAWGISLSAPASTIAALGGSVSLRTGFPVAATAFPAFWRGAVGLLVHGWIYAYFWTAAAHIYLLLRHDVDGTPWTEISGALERVKAPSPRPGTAELPRRSFRRGSRHRSQAGRHGGDRVRPADRPRPPGRIASAWPAGRASP